MVRHTNKSWEEHREDVHEAREKRARWNMQGAIAGVLCAWLFISAAGTHQLVTTGAMNAGFLIVQVLGSIAAYKWLIPAYLRLRSGEYTYCHKCQSVSFKEPHEHKCSPGY